MYNMYKLRSPYYIIPYFIDLCSVSQVLIPWGLGETLAGVHNNTLVA